MWWFLGRFLWSYYASPIRLFLPGCVSKSVFFMLDLWVPLRLTLKLRLAVAPVFGRGFASDFVVVMWWRWCSVGKEVMCGFLADLERLLLLYLQWG